MIRVLTLRLEADEDVRSATAWYEAERPGLGGQFLSELDRLFERIGEMPRQFPQLSEGVRRALMHRFPYGVYFRHTRGRTVVLAVLHLHRDPAVWKQRT